MLVNREVQFSGHGYVSIIVCRNKVLSSSCNQELEEGSELEGYIPLALQLITNGCPMKATWFGTRPSPMKFAGTAIEGEEGGGRGRKGGRGREGEEWRERKGGRGK